MEDHRPTGPGATGEEPEAAGPASARFLALVGVLVVTPLLVALLVVGAVKDGPSAAGPARGGVAPLDLGTVSAGVAAHFRLAAAHLEEYRQVPCWCGCQQFLGHRNLADCFVRADGRGWEAHAAGCGVCLGEAAIAERMLGDGATPADVTAAVGARFGPTAVTTPPATTT